MSLAVEEWGGLVQVRDLAYIRITGLSVRNSRGAGIHASGCSAIVIDGNATYNTVSSGVGVWNSTGVIVEGNDVALACNDGSQECITVAGSVEVPGRVEFVHPLHNLALVSFDPRLLDGTPIRAARLDPRELKAGEAVTVVGLNGDSRVRSITTRVASVEGVSFPLSRTLRFRESNLEVATLVNEPTDFDGVLADRGGRVRALWSSFASESGRDFVQVNRGMPVDVVLEMLAAVRDGTPLYSLEAEFEAVSITAARKLGRDRPCAI